MKRLLTCFIFTYLISSLSYGQSSYEIFKDSVNQKLKRLSSYNPHSPDENDIIDFDPDSLLSVAAEDITRYLKSEESIHFKIEDFSFIEHRITNDNQFETLVLGYHCGGSAGEIPRSIIVNHTKDKPRIYNIETETSFYEYHQLKDELYLCIGSSPGSGICRNYSAYAIDFSKAMPQFEPVFNGEHFFYLCNSDITFDDNEKELLIYIDFLPYKAEDETYEAYLNEQNYTYFSVEYDSEEDEQNPTVIFKSKFDGEKFIKPNLCQSTVTP